ncbi:sugar ABC transporter permease, partial [Streptomyces sp. NEAU-H3]|nr:sugar ABC transporter permease [Streptomyces sp. NEAU-H3]
MSTVPTTGPASLAPEPAHAADAPAASPRASGPRSRRGGSGGLFVAPFMIFFGLFLLVPLVYGLWMSFTDASLTGHGDSSFAGLGNYTEALTDSEVWK